MKKELKTGDRIRCASYIDLVFKAQELEKQGFNYRSTDERPDQAKRPKLYLEIVSKAEDGKRGRQVMEKKPAAETTAFVEEATEHKGGTA